MLGAVATAVWIHGGLLFGGALHGFDWAQHYHYYDWIRTALREYGVLPLHMPDAWHTTSFLANAQSPLLGPLVWLLAVVPTGAYVKTLVVVYTAAGLLGQFALARDLDARPAFAGCAAIAFAAMGFFAAHVSVGHHWSLGVYLLPGLVLGLRRAAGGSSAALLATGALDALGLLEGQHHPFLWQNGFLLLYAGLESARRRDRAALAAFAGIAGVAAALSAVRWMPVVAEFASYAPADRIAALPPGALAASLLWRGQGPATAGFGLEFAYGSGWWEYAFYLGAPALLFTAIGAAAGARRTWPLLASGGVAAALALDWSAVGVDPWTWLAHWPVLGSQRGPSRLFVLAAFAAIAAAPVGWERLARRLERARPGPATRRACTALGWGLAAVVALDLGTAARPWQAAAVGEAIPSRSHLVGAPTLVGAPGRVEAVEIAPHRLVYRVDVDRPATLVFPLWYDVEHDNWRARGFGSVKAAGGLLGIRLRPGEAEVVLDYHVPGLALGATVSGIAGLAWAVALTLALRRGRARATAPQPEPS